MQVDVTAFGRGAKAPDIRVRTGGIKFKADDELDAVFLAMLYRVYCDVWAKPDARVRLYKLLASEVNRPEDFKGFIDIVNKA